MTTADEMKAELASLLADPVFARSPVQARLLNYLVDASVRGKGKDLKSYSLAVEGLGKSPDFDSQADSYARVQVGRLRKSLDTFYATAGANRERRLRIEGGSYEVTLAPNDRDARNTRSMAWSMPSSEKIVRRLTVGALLVVFALGVVVLGRVLSNHRETPASWQTDDFPSLEVNVHVDRNTQEMEQMAEVVRQSMLFTLNKYQNISVSYDAVNEDYLLDIYLFFDNGVRSNVFLTDRTGDKLIWSEEDHFSRSGVDALPDINAAYAKLAFAMAHPTGVIHANERLKYHDPNTPYGCWLRFSARMYNNSNTEDDALEKCAEDWYAHAPNHPFAAGVYGWGLIDRSSLEITESGRERTLETAMRVLERAKGLNPNSILVQLGMIRAFAYTGRQKSMIAAVDQVVKQNPDNLDVLGMAGTMMVLQNQPEGEALLKRAISRHFNPPPWYFVGLFLSAMMRDDAVEARQALERLTDLNHTLAIRPALTAAYEAHTGKIAQARASWDEAKRAQPVLRISRKMFMDRLPMAPAVKKRLLEWLAPVLN